MRHEVEGLKIKRELGRPSPDGLAVPLWVARRQPMRLDEQIFNIAFIDIINEVLVLFWNPRKHPVVHPNPYLHHLRDVVGVRGDDFFWPTAYRLDLRPYRLPPAFQLQFLDLARRLPAA
jgi:hypothetical protein